MRRGERAARDPLRMLAAMTRRPAAQRSSPEDEASQSGLGSRLRGSVNSMVGAAGLNLPLRAVERLTTAIENASSILERLERASMRLDDVEDDFLERAYDTLDVIVTLQKDVHAMAARLNTVEREVREVRTLLTERFDQVPLLRARKRPAAR